MDSRARGPVALDVDGEPSLSASDVLTGLKVDVYGALSGTPTAPTITATEVEVEPGEFEGDVMSANQGLSFFQAGVDSIDDPFGDTVTSGPFDVLIAPNATIEGDATTIAGFFALFANLQQGETLTVEVEGIGSGNANEIVAYEIEAEVE